MSSSIVTVCASSTFETLISFTKFKTAILGTTATSTIDDDAMTNTLRNATDACETYVGRILRQQVMSERVPSFGGLVLDVEQTPVQTVTQILNDPDGGGAVIGSTTYSIMNQKSGLIYRSLGWAWSAGIVTDLVGHVVPGSELRIFQVDYTGGFVESTAISTGLSMPHDIEQACLETAKSWWLGRLNNPSVVEKAVGDLRVKFSGADARELQRSPIPTRAQGLLSPYQRV